MRCPYAFRFGRSFNLHAQCGQWRCSRDLYHRCRDRSAALRTAEARAAEARVAEESRGRPVVGESGGRTREVANLGLGIRCGQKEQPHE